MKIYARWYMIQVSRATVSSECGYRAIESLLKALGETRWIFATRLAVGVSVAAATVALSAASGLMAAIWELLAIISRGHRDVCRLCCNRSSHRSYQPWLSQIARGGSVVASDCFCSRKPNAPAGEPINLVLTVTVYSSVLLLSLWVSGYSRSREGAQLVAVIHGILAPHKSRFGGQNRLKIPRWPCTDEDNGRNTNVQSCEVFE